MSLAERCNLLKLPVENYIIYHETVCCNTPGFKCYKIIYKLSDFESKNLTKDQY
jgi:hypothetical protein